MITKQLLCDVQPRVFSRMFARKISVAGAKLAPREMEGC